MSNTAAHEHFSSMPDPVSDVPDTGIAATAGLPTPLSPLVGRMHEVAAATALLRQDDVRLVTLTGPGGVGKTRLALHVAGDLAPDFADGVAYLPLAPVHEPSLVLPTVAQALGLRGQSERPLIHRLRLLLHGRRLLLVLDNFEQVVAAAPVIAELLSACPGVRILVTSRIPLRITGERELPVTPLAVPNPERLPPLDDIIETEAVALFLARVNAVRPDFTVSEANAPSIVDICARLDGLPLAIELAAARCKLLSPQALQAHLSHRLHLLTRGTRDHPMRLQTMRDAIAWSYDLLTPDEQALFRRLSVFVNGFTLDAAEAVGGEAERENRSSRPPAVPPLFILDGIASLADQSLLRRVEGEDPESRFDMLGTIRDFGIEQLEASGEEDASRSAHAIWCLDLAERGNAMFWGLATGNWRSLVEPEHDNLRSGLAWLLDQGEVDSALRLATALEPFWWILGHASEGRQWLRRALDAGHAAPAALRAKALIVASRLAVALHDYADAFTLAEEGLTIARWHGDQAGIANAIDVHGIVAMHTARQDTAYAFLEDAIARYRELGDRGRLGWSLCAIGALGDLGTVETPGDQVAKDRAEACCDEALAIFRDLGQKVGIARALHGMAYLAFKRRDFEQALAASREAVYLLWEEGVRTGSGLASCLEGVADVAGMTGYAAQAARLYGAADALREASAVPITAFHRAEYDDEVAVARRALGDRAFAALWAAGRTMPLEQAIAEALRSFESDAADLLSTLTPRQREILDRIVAGKTNREIADELFISFRTVEDHVSNLLAKLGVQSRGEAARWAVERHGTWTQSDPPR